MLEEAHPTAEARREMFVGREREMGILREALESDGFQMYVLYGRRRVGKTALLEQLSQGAESLFFTAQLQGDLDNLRDFSHVVTQVFGLPASTPAFATWLDALTFVAESAGDRHLLVVIDELPYAARSGSSIASALQVAIDRSFSRTNCLMVLCGSNQGFMEGEVLGEKSPLFGRRSGQIKLRPFDFLDAARMLPGVAPEEQVAYYASLGGTPYYLAAVRPQDGYVDNMARLFFSAEGRMYEEPMLLMRQELREPATYVSIMRAVAGGANRPKEIADRLGRPATFVSTYLSTLGSLGLVERAVPFGESASSKRGIWRIADPSFQFWFHFVAPHVGAVEGGMGEHVGRRLLGGDRLAEYEGHLFETICRQWVLRQAAAGALPVDVTRVGSWWGTNSAVRERVDIDVVATDEIAGGLLVGECKWCNVVDESAALRTLAGRARLLGEHGQTWLYLFVKRPVEGRLAGVDGVLTEYGTPARVVTAAEMYEG